MNSRQLPLTDSGQILDRSPLPALRLALPVEAEERRRASLYRNLLRRTPDSLLTGGAEAAPPLQRGRMVPERIDALTLGRLLGKVLRRAGGAQFCRSTGAGNGDE